MLDWLYVQSSISILHCVPLSLIYCSFSDWQVSPSQQFFRFLSSHVLLQNCKISNLSLFLHNYNFQSWSTYIFSEVLCRFIIFLKYNILVLLCPFIWRGEPVPFPVYIWWRVDFFFLPSCIFPLGGEH